jgi:uncharacterized protein
MNDTELEILTPSEYNWLDILNLGYRYRVGDGINQNLKKGNEIYKNIFPYLKKEADFYGDADSQYLVGNEYLQGNFMKTDYKQAFKYFKMSAELGHSYAQYLIGEMYECGHGFDVNIKEALKWYKISAAHHNPLAYEDLGHFYRVGNNVKQCSRTAMEYFQKYIDHEWNHWDNDFKPTGYSEVCIGLYYEEGDIVKKDLKEAFKWYLKSAKIGQPYGQFELSKCYEFGKGTIINYKKANQWLISSSEQGYTDAIELLRSNNSIWGKLVKYVFKKSITMP